VQFRDFLVVLRARWRTVAACALIVLGATAAYTLTLTPSYTATARIYFSATGRPPGAGQQAQVGTYVITSQDLSTYIEVMNSPAVTDPLRQQLSLPASQPLVISASTPPQASVLDITAVSSSPTRAAEIANAVGPQLAQVAGKFSPLLAANGQTVEATAITPAVAPGEPTTPNVKRNLALGLLAGLVMGIGIAFGRHALDTKVRSEADLKAISDRPLLSALPLDKGTKGKPLTLITDPHGVHAESIRRLRTNLLFVDITTRKHSFVVTSAMPGEGKTTTVVNLAMALADTGARVLLVDGDLRNPSVARSMGLEGTVGLTTILIGSAVPDDVVQQWRDTSLYVLPAGQIPPNPSEILGSEPMATLFDHLTKEFDYVLVDSPPVLPVIDAVVINKLVGGLLFVVAADRTRKRDLSSAIKALATVDATPAGFALNMVSTGASDPYRYGYYRYGAQPPASTRAGRREKPNARAAAARH
jgi:capsular exopolysaccharide synthesis family protein